MSSQIRDGPILSQEKEREDRCEECGRRITIGLDGTEFGHTKGSEGGSAVRCPNRPDHGVDPTEGVDR